MDIERLGMGFFVVFLFDQASGFNFSCGFEFKFRFVKG